MAPQWTLFCVRNFSVTILPVPVMAAISFASPLRGGTIRVRRMSSSELVLTLCTPSGEEEYLLVRSGREGR